jgi:hypothetical protein
MAPHGAATRSTSRLQRLAALALALALAGPRCVRAFVYTPVLAPASAANITAAALGFPSTAARTAAVAAATSAAFGPTPANVVIKCALINMYNAYDNAFLDGFSGVATPVSAQLLAQLKALQPGSLLRVQSSDLDGVLVRVLQQLQSTIGFTLEWSVVTPPLSLLPPVSTSTDVFNAYAFGVMNQTCSLWPSPASPTRRLYFRQTIPVFTYGAWGPPRGPRLRGALLRGALWAHARAQATRWSPRGRSTRCPRRRRCARAARMRARVLRTVCARMCMCGAPAR